MARDVHVDVMKLAKNTDVIVHFDRMKEWKIRMWIASIIIKFGAWIGGFGFKLELEGDNG